MFSIQLSLIVVLYHHYIIYIHHNVNKILFAMDRVKIKSEKIIKIYHYKIGLNHSFDTITTGKTWKHFAAFHST